MREKAHPQSLSDDALLRRLSELVGRSRYVEADLVSHIAEVDRRRLYAREASPSMFAYCTDVLHLSEAEAWLRIRAARASREHPMLLAMLADGRLHLTGLAKLAPHLTEKNREALLRQAQHKSKRQIEEIVAALEPRPDAPAVMRKLPVRKEAPKPVLQLRPDAVGPSRRELRPDAVESAQPPKRAPRAVVEALAPDRHRIQFTASTELRNKLDRLKALMRSSVPDGDLATLIDEAVTEKLQRLESKRFGRTKAPRKSLGETSTKPSSRHIPAPVRRTVHERDKGQCTYVGQVGRRCGKKDDLELHHREPFGRGGDHDPKNLCLMCRAHNLLLAERDFGKRKMAQYRSSPDRVSEPMAVYQSVRASMRVVPVAGCPPVRSG